MRVLLLRRQGSGEIAEHVDDLARELPVLGIQALVEDAGPWIPNSTKGDENKEAIRLLRDRAKDVDIVHAFGYRAAWACADAFQDREAWMYTAYDYPRTTQGPLIERLNMAVKGFSTSFALARKLEVSGVQQSDAIWPGCRPPDDILRHKSAAREHWGLPTEGHLVCARVPDPHPNATPNDWGQDAIAAAWPKVREAFPGAHLAIIGQPGDEDWGQGVSVLGPVAKVAEVLNGCDLFVEAGRGVSFSRTACQAMSLAKPTLLRSDGGLPEMIAEHVSGFLFPDDSMLASTIIDVLQMDLTREAIGQAARVRYEEMFLPKDAAGHIADAYRDLL